MLIVHLFVLALHTLICVTFSFPPGVGGWLRLLLVALPGLYCLPFCVKYCILHNKIHGTLTVAIVCYLHIGYAGECIYFNFCRKSAEQKKLVRKMQVKQGLEFMCFI